MKKIIIAVFLAFVFITNTANSAYLKQPAIVEFSSLSALPQDATDYILECGVYYHWLGTSQVTTTKSIKIPVGCDTGIIGQSITKAPIVYLGTGTFLKSTSISDLNGAVIDNSDGTVRLTTTSAHPFIVGNVVKLSNNTNYNGFYTITAVPTTTTFDITETYVSETLSSGIAVGAISSLKLHNIILSSPIGTMFDITGSDRINTYIRADDVVLNNVSGLGKIDTISFLIGTMGWTNFGQGLLAEAARFTVEKNLAFSYPKTTTKNTSCTFDNVGNTVDATAHYMYDGDLVRLTTDGTLPTGLTAGVSDLNGAVIDNTDGTIRLTTTADHGFSTGETIFVSDTTNYDGFYEILDVPTTKTIDIKATYVSETLSSDTAQQVYFIVNKTTDDFQLSKTEGGSVETFTTDGTGNHEFFENTIGLTMRGSEYSFTLEKPVFANSPETFTAWKFEPTISDVLSRGSIMGASYDIINKYNHFTNGGLKQDYKYFSSTNTRGGFNSKDSGVIFITGNVDDTTITLANTIYEVVEGTPDTYNLERAYQSSTRLCYDSPSPSLVNAFAVVTMTKAGVTQAVSPHILKNGVDYNDKAEPVVDVINARQVTISDFDEIELKEGDCLSLGVENLDGTDNITFSAYKLGW